MSTDDEQIEALKLWWEENGTTLVISVALVLALLFGYRFWDSNARQTAQTASDVYQQILDVAAEAPASELTEEQISTVGYLSDQLKEDFGDTIYARYAALFMAKIHADADDLEQAGAALSWILDNPDMGMFSEVENPLLLTARSRLARIELAKGNADKALTLITAVDPGEFSGSYAEVEGDILLVMGRRDEAKAAFERAQEAGNTSALLQLKLNDLGA